MIKVDNLSFTYPGNTSESITSLNFEIREGEVFGFLGPSGAGKSTTQKILYKILSGYKGKILIKGKDLADWDKSYLEQIGVGFELPNHYEKLTGRENLNLFASFYPNATITKAEELFELIDMSDAVDKTVDTYSKGMKMRLNFIRAIQHNPEILFFDEPTSGLDPVNAAKIKQHILALKEKGKTIFITTHSMSTADDICDRVSFIVDGALQVTDTPENLKKKYGKEIITVKLQNAETEDFNLKEIGDNLEFIAFLKKGDVKSIKTQDATLEEVFIKITGQSLKS